VLLVRPGNVEKTFFCAESICRFLFVDTALYRVVIVFQIEMCACTHTPAVFLYTLLTFAFAETGLCVKCKVVALFFI